MAQIWDRGFPRQGLDGAMLEVSASHPAKTCRAGAENGWSRVTSVLIQSAS